MTANGVILYGPPGSGKDTITAEMNQLDNRYTLLTKLKLGSGRLTGYRMTTEPELASQREAGRLLVETHRYGNVYAVDQMDIDQITASGGIPVLHMGNIADVKKLSATTPLTWLRVMLWTTREACEQRSRQRGDTDTSRRLEVWDETNTEVKSSGTGMFELVIRTDQTRPSEAAQAIACHY